MISALKGLATATGINPGGTRFESPPPRAEPDGPPGNRSLLAEALTAVQLPRLLASSPRLLAAPKGDGSTVIDMPGWRAPEASMAPLRSYLNWLGYDARTWGLGVNLGDPERDARFMAEEVSRIADLEGRPVALVGWSLGGVVAREVAREVPDSVSQVITFGSPVVGGPNHTVAARSYSAEDRHRAEHMIETLDREKPLQVPVTVIFTRRDGVVNWRACIDQRTPGARHVEVRSTHIGLGIDPDVWITVAETLAQPAPV